METHLLPYASVRDMGSFLQASGRTLQLPHLQQLLRRLAPVQWLRPGEDGFITPHEAAMLQLAWPEYPPDARPFASLAALVALQQAQAIDPADGWALMTPGHLQISTDSIALLDPARLALAPDHNRQLRDALAQLWAPDDVALTGLTDGRWLARAPWLKGLDTASEQRAIGQDVRLWASALGQSARLQRLQAEAQMLLYDHPVNTLRSSEGLLPINVLWVSGTGVVPAPLGSMPVALQELQLHPELQAPALQRDYHRWVDAWQDWDARVASALTKRPAGQPLRLILAGERHAVVLAPAPAGLGRRLAGHWQQWRGHDAARQLLDQL